MPRSESITGLDVTATSYAPSRRMDAHAHERTAVSVVLGGDVTEHVEGRSIHAGALAVVLKPRRVMHEDAFGARGAVLLSLHFPDGAGDVGLSYGWRRCAAAARVVVEACVAAVSGDGVDASRRAIRALAPRDDVGELRTPAFLDEARRRFDVAHGERVSLAAVAAQVGVHPGHLTRAFRARFGVSPIEYVLDLRVRRAADALAMSDAPLCRIAVDVGFADQPHLTRVFRRETGLTPAAYRRLSRAARSGSVLGWVPREPRSPRSDPRRR